MLIVNSTKQQTGMLQTSYRKQCSLCDTYDKLYLLALKRWHTHTRLMALCPGIPGWASTRKVKPIWILLRRETVSVSGISWAICKSAPLSKTDNHASTPPLSFFTGRMPYLLPNQQRQSTEGISKDGIHTHTHPFNGPLSRTTRASRYQKGKTNLDFTEARDERH